MVKFTNLLAQSANDASAQGVWCKRCHSPTELHSTLLVHRSKSYAQVLQLTLYAMRQKDECKSTGVKAACKMMMNLTPG